MSYTDKDINETDVIEFKKNLSGSEVLHLGILSNQTFNRQIIM